MESKRSVSRLDRVIGFLLSLLPVETDNVRLEALKTLSRMNALKSQILIEAYAVWEKRGLLVAHGIGVKRVGSISAGVNKGVMLIIEVILLSISGQFVVAFVPSTLTGFATAALTSVSSSVQTIFQTGLSLTFVATIILLYIGILVETFRAY